MQNYSFSETPWSKFTVYLERRTFEVVCSGKPRITCISVLTLCVIIFFHCVLCHSTAVTPNLR